MKIRWNRSALLFLTIALSAPFAIAQTSVAGSIYGAFNGSTNGNGVQQSPANQAGALFELRHISNAILGFEATYSFNRADETYTKQLPQPSLACPGTCEAVAETLQVPANAHEITVDWTPSLHFANFRPFGVLGLGVLLNVPSGSQTLTTIQGTLMSSQTVNDASTSTRAVYVYGAGLDWGLLPHLGLRVQYRGNLYSAPDLSSLYSSTGAFTHSAEPMVGAYFNF